MLGTQHADAVVRCPWVCETCHISFELARELIRLKESDFVLQGLEEVAFGAFHSILTLYGVGLDRMGYVLHLYLLPYRVFLTWLALGG